jgi:hypothetical protein
MTEKKFKTIGPPPMSNRVPASDNDMAVKLSKLHAKFTDIENSGYSGQRIEMEKNAISHQVADLLKAHDKEVEEFERWIAAGRPDLPTR